MNNNIIRWGVIGLGKMANAFAHSISECNNAKLLSCASNTQKKLIDFSKNFKISKELSFNNYDELIANKNVDAVYISTLNNTHFEIILKCIKNKKNVLCEKPMTLNYEEAKIVEENLSSNQILFAEAIAYRFHPIAKEILKTINENEIGKINKIEINLGFLVKRPDKNSRLFNKSLGGGAILDIGCYPISFINLFTKDKNEVKFTKASGNFNNFGVDGSADADLVINQSIEAKIKISIEENFEDKILVYGDDGHVIINSPWMPQQKTFFEVTKKNRQFKKFVECDKSIYANQISKVSEAIINNKYEMDHPFMNIKESLKVMKLLTEWNKLIKN